METYRINPNVTAFYFGGDIDPGNAARSEEARARWDTKTWLDLGMVVYAVHSGESALVYDTLCSPAQAAEVKNYLEGELGINKFTVVLSHWHLGHVGGNELYRGFNIVACRKTREELLSRREAIELGSWLGKPGINPLRLPDVIFESRLSIYLDDDLEVALYNFNVHSEDSVCAYIPKYKILLPGDMLEDSAPFISNPEGIPAHLENFASLRALDIERILPNHGRSRIIKSGGYSKAFIESVAGYLEKMYGLLSADAEAAVPDLRTFASEYLDKGIIEYWPPYEGTHQDNIVKMRAFVKTR